MEIHLPYGKKFPVPKNPTEHTAKTDCMYHGQVEPSPHMLRHMREARSSSNKTKDHVSYDVGLLAFVPQFLF